MHKILDDSCLKSIVDENEEKEISNIKEFVQKQLQLQKRLNLKELRKKIIVNIPIKNAVKAWLNTIQNKETKRKYYKVVNKIFFEKPYLTNIEPNTSIGILSYTNTQGIYNQIEKIWSQHEPMKRVCLTAYGQFCEYIRAETLGIIQPEPGLKEKKHLIEAKEIYDKVDWNHFINLLPVPYNLIAELVFVTAKLYQYRLKVSDTQASILSINTHQIDFQKNIINIYAKQSYHSSDFSCLHSSGFMHKLLNYLEKRSGIVFVGKKGNQLHPNHVTRAFARVSKKLNLIKEITPSVLCWAGIIKSNETYFITTSL